jgi:hypothetical protein
VHAILYVRELYNEANYNGMIFLENSLVVQCSAGCRTSRSETVECFALLLGLGPNKWGCLTEMYVHGHVRD